jgi:hypothetical protein
MYRYSTFRSSCVHQFSSSLWAWSACIAPDSIELARSFEGFGDGPELAVTALDGG